MYVLINRFRVISTPLVYQKWWVVRLIYSALNIELKKFIYMHICR